MLLKLAMKLRNQKNSWFVLLMRLLFGTGKISKFIETHVNDCFWIPAILFLA